MIEDYYNGTYLELAEKVKANVSERRFMHIQAVVKYAEILAQQNGVDLDMAKVAAWVHDYAKEIPDQVFLKYIDDLNLDPNLKEWGNPIWHGVVGAEIIKDQLGIDNPEILLAVEQHTTGAKDMSELSKVLFMADFLADGRQMPNLDQLRKITNQNIDDGIREQLSYSIKSLIDRKLKIHPKTLEAYNYWITK